MHSWNMLFLEIKVNVLSYMDCADFPSFARTSKEGAELSFQELLHRAFVNLNAFLKKQGLMQSDQSLTLQALLEGEWAQPGLPEPSSNAKLQMWCVLTDFLADTFPDVARKEEFADWLASESMQSINHGWFWQIAIYKFLLNMGIQLVGDERNKPFAAYNLSVAKELVFKSAAWDSLFYDYNGRPIFVRLPDTRPALDETLAQFGNELLLSGFQRLSRQFTKRCQVTFLSKLPENQEVARQAIAERDSAIAKFSQHDFLLQYAGRNLYFNDIRTARVFYKVLEKLDERYIAFLKQVLHCDEHPFRIGGDGGFASYQPSRLISTVTVISKFMQHGQHQQYWTALFKDDSQHQIRIALYRRMLFDTDNERPRHGEALSYRFLGDRLQDAFEKAFTLYRLFPSHSPLLHASTLFYVLGRNRPLGKLFERAKQFLIVIQQMQQQNAANYQAVEEYILDYLTNIKIQDSYESYIDYRYFYANINLPLVIEGVACLWPLDAERFNRYLALARERQRINLFFYVFRYWSAPYQQEPLVTQEQMQVIVRSPLFEQLMIYLFTSRREIVSDEDLCKLIKPSSALWQLPAKTVVDLFRPVQIRTKFAENRDRLLADMAKLEKKRLLDRWQRLGPHVLVLNNVCYSLIAYYERSWLSLLLSKFPDASFEQLYRHIAHLLQPATKKINKKALKEALATALLPEHLPPHIATCLFFDCTSADVTHYRFLEKLMAEISVEKLDQLADIIIFRDESAARKERNVCYLLYSVMRYPPFDASLQRAGLTVRDMVRIIVQHASDANFITFLHGLYVDAERLHRSDIDKEALLAYCQAHQLQQTKRSHADASGAAAVSEEREAKRARHDVRLFAQLPVPAAVVPPTQQQDEEAMDLDAPLPAPASL